jgi:short-subunit dehydrogenase
MKDLRGKLVMVTGAASGIGRALATRFSKEGAVLALVDIDEKGLASLAGEIRSEGRFAHTYVTDLRDSEQVAHLKRRLVSEAGVPDVLVNSAGVAIVCCIEETSLEDWHWVLDLNLWGYINVIHLFLADMFQRGSGHVVNVASAAGLFAVPYQAPYNTSKHAVMGLTDSFRQEGRRYGVGATAVCPGMIDTPIVGSVRLLGFKESTTSTAGRIAASPDKLAIAIVNGVKKNKPLVIYPPAIRVIYGLKKLSQRFTDLCGAVVARVLYKMHHEEGAA